MELLHLEYFLRVAEKNSISKAAAEAHVVSSAISSHIKVLEEDLGVPLFCRIGNSISLNENGKILYRHAKTLLRLFNDTKKEISDNCGRLDYDLTIVSSALPNLLPHIIRDFKDQYKDIRLKIVQYYGEIDLDETDCDLLLYSGGKYIHGPHNRLICKDPIGLAVSEQSPLANVSFITPAQLSGETLISCPQLSGYYSRIEQYMNSLGLRYPKSILSCDYLPFLSELVASNMGVALLPRLSWLRVREKNIHFLDIRDVELYQYIQIRWRTQGYLSKASELFICHLCRYFKHLN